MLIINTELGAMADTTGNSVVTDIRQGSSSYIWVHLSRGDDQAVFEAHEHDEIYRMFNDIAAAAMMGFPAFDVRAAEVSWHVDDEER